jgi:hypothetical protein
MSSFDLNQELVKAHSALAEVEAYIAQGHERLRTVEGFGARCTELALLLRETVVALPLREPPPELTLLEIPLIEYELRRAKWYERIFKRREVDVERRLRMQVERRRMLEVEDARWPGRGSDPVTVTVETTDYIKVPVRRGRAFRWTARPYRREVSLSADLFPLDAASLTRLQAAYRRRKEELNREVADVSGFIRQAGGTVTEQEQATARLQADAEELSRRVAALPAPPDAEAELLQMERRIREILQGMEDMHAEIESREARLRTLREQVQMLCPEVNV